MNKSTIILLAVAALAAPPATGGEMWLAWPENVEGRSRIYYSLSRGGAWETLLFPPAEHYSTNHLPCLGIDGAGRPWIVWAAREGEENAAIYYSFRQGRRWASAARVGTGSGWESNPAIAFDASGNPWVAWSRRSGDTTEIFCAGWQGEGFRPETMVSAPDDSPDFKPLVSLDESGSPVVTWRGRSNRQSAFFENRFKNGAWTGEVLISPAAGAGTLSDLPGAAALPAGAELPLPRPAEELAEGGAWIAFQGPGGAWESRRLAVPGATAPAESAAWSGATTARDQLEFTGYGDSITYGSDGEDDGNWYGILLKGMLETTYPGNTYYFRNEGYPGSRTYEMLDGGGIHHCPGIDRLLNKYDSATVLIMGGTNDIKDGDDYSDIKWNLSEMANRSRLAGVEPIVATIIPRWDASIDLERAQVLNEYYILPLAVEMGIKVADPWQEYLNYGDWKSLYLPDKIHPKWPEGYQEIADAWFPKMPPPPPPAGDHPLDDILKWARDWATRL